MCTGVPSRLDFAFERPRELRRTSVCQPDADAAFAARRWTLGLVFDASTDFLKGDTLLIDAIDMADPADPTLTSPGKRGEPFASTKGGDRMQRESGEASSESGEASSDDSRDHAACLKELGE